MAARQVQMKNTDPVDPEVLDEVKKRCPTANEILDNIAEHTHEVVYSEPADLLDQQLLERMGMDPDEIASFQEGLIEKPRKKKKRKGPRKQRVPRSVARGVDDG